MLGWESFNPNPELAYDSQAQKNCIANNNRHNDYSQDIDLRFEGVI